MAEELVSNNEAAKQFELVVDGKTALLSYRIRRKAIVFLHIEVPEELEGHGIASRLARVGLEFAKERGLAVVPLCPFMWSYLRRHQEYLDLVRGDYRMRLSARWNQISPDGAG